MTRKVYTLTWTLIKTFFVQKNSCKRFIYKTSGIMTLVIWHCISKNDRLRINNVDRSWEGTVAESWPWREVALFSFTILNTTIQYTRFVSFLAEIWQIKGISSSKVCNIVILKVLFKCTLWLTIHPSDAIWQVHLYSCYGMTFLIMTILSSQHNLTYLQNCSLCKC